MFVITERVVHNDFIRLGQCGEKAVKVEFPVKDLIFFFHIKDMVIKS